MAKRGRPSKNPGIEYNGIMYYRAKRGEYRSSASVTGVRRKLHEQMWKDAHGPVPDDHIVRFIDGDKDNVVLTNLVCERRAKHRVQDLFGVRYYEKPSGYFVCSPDKTNPGERYAHRAVWVHHHGVVPEGFVVHHRDHDKANNTIDNLQILPVRGHCSYHTRKRLAEDRPSVLRGIEAAQEAAKAWHKSEEGLAWHRAHGKNVFTNLQKESRVCTQCGKEYEGTANKARRGFCSMACQSAARRDSGVDNETRVCVSCGAEFTTNRYSKVKTCCRSCGGKAARRTRAGL